MKIISDPQKLNRLSRSISKKGRSIGLVPTMGALHEGHLRLVREAKKKCDAVIVSIFVNPIQFGPNEDFKKYPRPAAADKKLLAKEKVDILFNPSVRQMYPEDPKTFVLVEDLGDYLCGRSRPGHFKGVTTVVAKLFNIAMPHKAFFGAKDFQQQAIIRQMVKDLNMPVKIVTVPTVREADGLAISSRNKYLSKEEREQAPILYFSLKMGAQIIRSGEKNAAKVISQIKKLILSDSNFKIDYVSISDPKTFREYQKINKPALISVAAYIGKTRLIDNILVR